MGFSFSSLIPTHTVTFSVSHTCTANVYSKFLSPTAFEETKTSRKNRKKNYYPHTQNPNVHKNRTQDRTKLKMKSQGKKKTNGSMITLLALIGLGALFVTDAACPNDCSVRKLSTIQLHFKSTYQDTLSHTHTFRVMDGVIRTRHVSAIGIGWETIVLNECATSESHSSIRRWEI